MWPRSEDAPSLARIIGEMFWVGQLTAGGRNCKKCVSPSGPIIEAIAGQIIGPLKLRLHNRFSCSGEAAQLARTVIHLRISALRRESASDLMVVLLQAR